jgi:hypothetical protein
MLGQRPDVQKPVGPGGHTRTRSVDQ